MFDTFLKYLRAIAIQGYRLHDWACDVLEKHLFGIKRAILVVAHLGLFGIFFPSMQRGFGQAALAVLLVIVFLSPLSRIFRTRLLLQLMGLRREMGILMGYLATVHVLIYVIGSSWMIALPNPFQETGLGTLPLMLWAGFAAYVLTLPLLFTSNDLALRLLGGKHWKSLHRLVYLLLVFALLHEALRLRGGMQVLPAGYGAATLRVLGTLSIYAFLKLLAWRNFLRPLREAIDLVATDYARWRDFEKASEKPPIE